MPLNRQSKAGRIAHIDRLWRAIGRIPIHDNPRTGPVDPLPMQRIGHHLGGAEQRVKGPPVADTNLVAQRELLLERAVEIGRASCRERV